MTWANTSLYDLSSSCLQAHKVSCLLLVTSQISSATQSDILQHTIVVLYINKWRLQRPLTTPDTEHSLAINTGIGTAGTNQVHIKIVTGLYKDVTESTLQCLYRFNLLMNTGCQNV